MASGLPARPLKSSRAKKPFSGTVRVPGDKSISHRSLILGALSSGETRIKGLLTGEDIMATARAMESYGAIVTPEDDGIWTVRGQGVGGLLEPDDVIDFGNAGTGIRLTMGVAAGYGFASTFTGDGSLRKRPMERVLKPLREMGAEALCRSGGRIPLTIRGHDRLMPMVYDVPVPSAQVKSAVLLAGLHAPGETTVIEKVATRDHTERMLKGFGADIDVTALPEGGSRIVIRGQPDLKGQTLTIPADPSSAAFLIVAGLIVEGSDIAIEDVLLNPSRTGLITTLQEMGGDIVLENVREEGGETLGTVRVKGSRLNGVSVPEDRAPSMIDEYPVLAMAASVAEGKTHMAGAGEMRIKETDRLAAVENGLKANGVDVTCGPDWMTVTGMSEVPGGGLVASELDHRIAMSFAVLGLVAKSPVRIDDGAPVQTSFPGFESLMNGLGADISVAELADA